MRYSTYINNQKCLEWDLNPTQGALFDLINQSASWAQAIAMDGTVFYWVSKGKVIEQLPLFYKKMDTVYRHFTDLHKKGLIEYRKQNDKDLIRLTAKGREWNEFNPELNNTLGSKSEPARMSIRTNSDLNPTDNNINNNINNTPLPPTGESANADEKKGKSEKVKFDLQGVVNSYNEVNEETGAKLSFAQVLSDKRKVKIKKFLLSLKRPTTECAKNYFEALFSMLRPFHFGEEKNSSWKANFDWAISEETVIKVREENL
ncbi:TPA: hypothetical protein ACPDWD_001481 [Pasteurella multocida]